MSGLAVFCFANCLIVLFIRWVEGTAQVLVYAAFWGGLGCAFASVGVWLAARRNGRAVGGRRIA